ncbi:purine-cytosine permease family protein [Desmospora profundinema]|uniref:Cytosine permease n=1 Tax=Desmospora profundinema TaxID=1571184 RepID=A0ABU1IP53_9BACL|nr:cytosine permease [Desmospora profundinema]MDR6226173.1 cytosine permease [Desmospora profundinema]
MSKQTGGLDYLTFFSKDDYARQPVPIGDRRGWFPMILVWFALGTDIVAALIGSVLAQGQTVMMAIIAVVIANVILGVIGGLCCYIGATTGLPTGIITRFAFGENGAKVVTWVIMLVFFAAFGVTVGLFGESLHYLLLEVFGIEIPVAWAGVIGGVLMTITATVGYIAIERLSIVAFPLMLFLMGGLFATVLGTEGKADILTALPRGGITMTLGSAISFVVASWMIIVVICPDIARWAKTRKQAFFSGFFGFLLGNSMMITLAIFLVRITGIEDVIDIFLSIGWGLFAIMILILAQWTTNDNLLYSSGLALSSLIRFLPKYALTLIVGVVGSAIAFFQIHNYFLVYITLMGSLLSPIAAIYLVEYFFLNRHRFMFAFIQDKKVAPVYWTAIISWVCASSVGIMTTPAEEGGLGLFTITTASSIDTFLIAAILHFVLGKFTSLNRPQKEETAHA